MNSNDAMGQWRRRMLVVLFVLALGTFACAAMALAWDAAWLWVFVAIGVAVMGAMARALLE